MGDKLVVKSSAEWLVDDEWRECESPQSGHETCTVLEGLSNTTVHLGEE